MPSWGCKKYIMIAKGASYLLLLFFFKFLSSHLLLAYFVSETISNDNSTGMLELCLLKVPKNTIVVVVSAFHNYMTSSNTQHVSKLVELGSNAEVRGWVGLPPL